MPLVQSGKKEAMGKNIAAEMHAGKPQKQSIAIAYNVMRKNRGKKKHMYGGGEASTDSDQDAGQAAAQETANKMQENLSNASKQYQYEMQKAQYAAQQNKAHGGMMKPHEAVSLKKAMSNKQSDWQHTNEFAEGGEIHPEDENMSRGHDSYDHSEADHNEDLNPGSSVISEADQGYVDPEHARRPKDHYMPEHEDMGRNMALGGKVHAKQSMDDHLEGKQDEVHHMAGGGFMGKHPHHIAIIIHKKMAHGGKMGYFDGGYTGADGGEVPEDEGMMGKVEDYFHKLGKKDLDNPMTKGISEAGKPKPTPTPSSYASGGPVDDMGEGEDDDEDSEQGALPFEDEDNVPISVMRGYDSKREDTEGMHNRKNKHGAFIKKFLRSRAYSA